MRFGFFWIACLALGQDFSGIQLEKVSGGHRFTEGPLWSKYIDGLLFCEVPSNMVLAYHSGKGLGKYLEQAGGASGLAYDAEGRLLIAEGKKRRIVRLSANDDKKVEVLAERFEGKRFNGPNDIVVRKDGQIYFSDPAFGAQSEVREMDFHGVYHMSPKGELSLIAKPKGRPNGVTLSPNGRILYVANSDERKVYAYDLDSRGKAGNERVFLAGLDGVPDGLRTDEKGNVYVAANHVYIFSPLGKGLHTIHMGEKPSNMAFGDADRMTLYITAKTSVYRARMKVKGAVSE